MRARWRWLALLIGLAVGLVIVGAAAWHDLSGARADLIEARSVLGRTLDDAAAMRTHDGRVRARAQIDDALTHVASARQKVSGSVFVSALRVVPGLAAQRSGALALVDDSRTGALV